MRDLEVVIVQHDIIWENTQENLLLIEKQLLAMSKQVDLVVLPEMFHCGFTMNPENVSEPAGGGEVVMWMKSLAARLHCSIIGSVVEKYNSSFVNRLYVVNDQNVSYYDKRHLFRMGGEHEHYKQGTKRTVVNVKGWRICPLICYDLRFPVWSRNMDDYDVLIYIANWPASRSEVWNILLKARAIENQSYVIGVNRVGEDMISKYDGGSQVIDAKGRNMVMLDNKEQIEYASLSYEAIDSFRLKFPVWKDRDEFEFKI